MKEKFLALITFFKNIPRIALIVGLVIILSGAGYVVYRNVVKISKQKVQYETTTVAKGTLTTVVSGSGTITTGNTTSITTGATGTVKTLYVKNGDTVTKGDKIAEITLDEYGQKRQAAAWLSYVNAKNAVNSSKTNKESSDLDMWNARQAILDAEDDIDYMLTNPINPDTNEKWTDGEKSVLYKSLEKAKIAFTAYEQKFVSFDADTQNASVRVTSAYYDYKQVASTILAPESGTIQNLVLAVGTVISNTSDSSISIDTGTSSTNSLFTNTSLSATSQSVGFIKSAEGVFKATVNLTEIDIPSIKPDQKVTITMDAFPDNTFTGKVLAVDTNGSVSSGVTTYPVTILLDPTTIDIYPKMAVDAEIITSLKSDVLLVPTSAISTVDGVSAVQILRDGKPTSVTVTIGSANDTETEITSGLAEGNVVVISMTSSANAKSTSSTKTTSTSIFSGMGGMGGGMGGPPGQ